MGFFSSLFGFGLQEKEVEVSPQPASPAGISYDATLISQLKEDHQQLVRLFIAIKTAAAEERFNEIPRILSEFKLDLQTHLALENVRFYVYVQQHYAQDLETSDFITGLRSEMNGIARAVMKFVEKYSIGQLNHTTAANFNAELAEIGTVLTRRIQLEESRLYALYQRHN